jgi:hypothetical protein
VSRVASQEPRKAVQTETQIVGHWDASKADCSEKPRADNIRSAHSTAANWAAATELQKATMWVYWGGCFDCLQLGCVLGLIEG